ncbi:MAG TPA: hypothetical protein VID03_03170 [Acidimicrobiia bacterium]
MTFNTPGFAGHRRPPSIWACISLLTFLGVTAVGGGLAMLFDVGGASPPEAWLQSIPLVDSWVLPGLVLAVGFGLGSLLVAFAMLTQERWPATDWIERISGHHWSWLGAIALGLGQLVWIGLELVYLPEFAWLQPLYGAIGLALVTIPWLPSARSHLTTASRRTARQNSRKISPNPI